MKTPDNDEINSLIRRIYVGSGSSKKFADKNLRKFYNLDPIKQEKHEMEKGSLIIF